MNLRNNWVFNNVYWIGHGAFSTNGRQFAICTQDGRTLIYDIFGKQVASFPKHNGILRLVKFSSNGKWLATASEDGCVYVWNASKCQNLFSFRPHQGEVTGLTFSKDSEWIISSGSDAKINARNLLNCNDSLIDNHKKPIVSMKRIWDSNVYVSIDRGGKVCVWRGK